MNTPFYHGSNKAQKKPHGYFEVECSRSEHHIEGITQETLVEVPPQSMICLAVPYDRLYSYSLAEEPLLFLFRVWRVACLGNTGYHDVRLSAHFLPAIPSVPRKSFDFPAIDPADLLHCLVYRMTVVFIAER